MGWGGWADSGLILTSPDGVSWTARTLGIPSTTMPPTIGLGVFECVAYGNGQFVAVGQSGTIATSPDGRTWTPRPFGTTGQFYSVTYGNGLFVVVGMDNGPNVAITLISSDGITWTPTLLGTIGGYNSVAYGNGQFVALGGQSPMPSSNPEWRGDSIFVSTNGLTWTNDSSTGLANHLFSVAYGNGLFVVVSDLGTIFASQASR